MGSWESLRKRCGGSIYSSYPVVATWLDAFSHLVEPRILLAEEGGEIVGIVPLALRRQKVVKLSVRTLGLVGDIDRMLGFGGLAPLIDPARSHIAERFADGLGGVDWNILRVRFMEDSMNTARFLEGVQEGWGGAPLDASVMMVCPIPDGGDIASKFGKAHRKTVRHLIRKLEREADMEFRSIPPEGIEAAVDVYAQQHIRRWESKGGSMLRDPKNVEFMKAITSLAVSNGFGFAHELVVDGTVAAQRFGFIEGESAWAYMTGMNDDCAKYSPGAVLYVKVMEALREKGAKELNLGEGGQEHKYHLGAQETRLVGMRADRGVVSSLSRAVRSTAFNRLDSAIGIRRRLLKDS